MRYMLLIYENETEQARRSRAEEAEIRCEHGQLRDELRSLGKYQAGDALEGTGTATTVRIRAGKTLVTDGPFAETREQLAGYLTVEAKDLDDAMSIAGRMPAARHGSVEIRPVRQEVRTEKGGRPR